jgi:uncharacterized protein YkwD
MWALAAGLLVGMASLAVAASASIAPASVSDRAWRVSPPDEPPLDPSQRAAADMIALVNVERGERGLPFVYPDPRVAAAAEAHAGDMAANRRMQHSGSDGSDAGLRLQRAGYAWSDWGENIGAGFVEPKALFDAWMNSPAHREHLIGDFRDIGVGAAATPDGVVYWSLVVATPVP